jgi:hypothetical protein
MVYPFEVSHSQLYEDIVDVSLFYSYLSSKKPVCNKNDRGVGHAGDRFVGAIDLRFSHSRLFNGGCGSLFKVWSAKAKVLTKENMNLRCPSPPKSIHEKYGVIVSDKRPS